MKDSKIKAKYGSEEYWKKLIELADPAGELRKQDPEKWEKIYEYAYEYSLKYGKKTTKDKQEDKDGSIGTKSTTPFPGGGGGAYNRDGAVNYAYTYVYNYNKAYHKFSADCTNFVSQCLKEGGGIPMVDEGWNGYWDSDDWFYYRNGSDDYDSKNDDSWSWSWVKVESLYEHLTNRGIGQVVPSVDNLEIGDIIQMDFGPDGVYDHSMIVTKVERTATKKTEIYLTYHTEDKKDVPLSDLKAKYPKAQFRYIHIIY
ncbi:hypothetical protein Csac_2580 [Caldicellulosiruptor saccharolyticus DSM 8903]|uniref:Putative amidase domain-containing protein n=1 Tax=Caldicellulosiruptor saccharolyticus (strain ATCC 43494 / DSM 8903 / Tp8T 6331) TaxID=351627 RepID=A4XML8_CALS8|nr:amidase domain-containing protein [Caldicellulosiruptor saccharolyticus]ABP68153.1 hypothetical protein Csac_2580 [Caldicellulosiruptor saccharolyticus DSM 8903]